jgi:hypothetical protein
MQLKSTKCTNHNAASWTQKFMDINSTLPKLPQINKLNHTTIRSCTVVPHETKSTYNTGSIFNFLYSY